jgi:hypothetical protein
MAEFAFDVPESAIRARTQEWLPGAPSTGLVSLGDTLVAAGGDGRLHFWEPDAATPVVSALMPVPFSRLRRTLPASAS